MSQLLKRAASPQIDELSPKRGMVAKIGLHQDMGARTPPRCRPCVPRPGNPAALGVALHPSETGW